LELLRRDKKIVFPVGLNFSGFAGCVADAELEELGEGFEQTTDKGALEWGRAYLADP
jgi:hypothetical protein